MAATDAPQLSPPPSGESVKPNEKESLDAKLDPIKEKNGNWPFIEPEPIREDQVQNAVKFLSHPKVKGSPIVHRRSFLEKKGLTREEIDEAFRRVPDPAVSESVHVAVPLEGRHNFSQGGQESHSALPSSQAIVPAKQHPISQQLVGSDPLQMSQAPARPHWSQIVLAVGVLSAAGAGAGVLFKRILFPKFKAWLRWVVLEEESAHMGKLTKSNPVEEAASAAAAAANAAAAAASSAVNACQEMLISRNKEWEHMRSIVDALESQREELKIVLMGLNTALQNLEKSRHVPLMSNSQSSMVNSQPLMANSQLNGRTVSDYQKAETNGTWHSVLHADQIEPKESIKIISKPSNFGLTSPTTNGIYNEPATVRPSSAPPNVGPDRAPHSAAYEEVIAMLERGEKPPGIKDINDKPPNPNQPLSTSRLQPRPKPWESVQVQNNSSLLTVQNSNSESSKNFAQRWSQGISSISQQVKHPSFTNTVPVTYMNNAEPAWQQKKAEPEMHTDSSWPPQNSVKITEIESAMDGDANGTGSSSRPSSSGSRGGVDSNSSSLNVSMGRPGWVPPAVPLTVMPGAAAAIRYKKSVPKDEMMPLPLLEEEVSSASTSQAFATTEEDTLSSSVAESVKLHGGNEGQEREPPESPPLENPSCKDIKEEDEVQQEL